MIVSPPAAVPEIDTAVPELTLVGSGEIDVKLPGDWVMSARALGTEKSEVMIIKKPAAMGKMYLAFIFVSMVNCRLHH